MKTTNDRTIKPGAHQRIPYAIHSLHSIMVKRAKSPDTAEDEKYFTVYQPYPLNANWELSVDYIAFSRWMAGCIGTAPLHALHYKPKVFWSISLYPLTDRAGSE